MTTTYTVIRRSDTSRHTDGTGEILSQGNPTDDLVTALIETDARNLLEGEGTPRWTVESSDPADHDEYGNLVDAPDIEQDQVESYLVDVLDVPEAEANRLVA